MNTTLTIKTEKRLRVDAKRTAEELGVPLTTVINAFLRQFVREREITLSAEPRPTKEKMALWESISDEMDREKDTRMFTDAEALITDLGLPQ